MNSKAYGWLCTSDGYTKNLTMEEYAHLLACLCEYWGPTELIKLPNKEAVANKKTPQVCDSNVIYVDFSRKALVSAVGAE